MRRLESIHLRFEWLVIRPLRCSRGSARANRRCQRIPLGLAVWVLSCLALRDSACARLARPGVWIAIVGMALNILVVLVQRWHADCSAARWSVSSAVDSARSMGFYQLAGPGRCWRLAMSSVLKTGVYRVLVSPGDAFLCWGCSADGACDVGRANRHPMTVRDDAGRARAVRPPFTDRGRSILHSRARLHIDSI